jgi:catechol 2,3-dioxygenase-like lactoylglutathione lyase family enzyme
MGESEAIGDDNAPPRLDDLGIHHVAFWVDDLEVFAKRLERRSAKILVPASRKNPHETGGGKRGTSSTMFFEDPSGNILQLDERPKRRG